MTPKLRRKKKKKLKSGLDEEMTNKLVKETIAPWRGLRVFFYGSLGSGALIGGLITLTGTLAAMSGARPDLNMDTELLNLGIDFGAVAFFALLAKLDFDKKDELDVKLDKKIEAQKEQKRMVKEMRVREQELGNLLLDIQVSADGSRRDTPVVDLQRLAKQHIIMVIGNKKACRDALVGANLGKMDFSLSNVLVVPYEIDSDTTKELSRPDGGGFGDTLPPYATQPYVARATGDGWEDYVNSEIQDAVKQSGEKVKTEGIVIVVESTGKVIRRGVGTVPWRQMVEQLKGDK